jgi:hypothetical protein
MRRRLIPVTLAAALLVVSSSVAWSAPVYVWTGAAEEWSDVNKTSVIGAPDSLLCWAAAGANVLSWTHWWGWAGGDYLDTAAEIFAAIDAGWTNTEGTVVEAYGWWLTDRNVSAITGNPLDSQGQDFYPGVEISNTPASSVWGWFGNIPAMYPNHKDNINFYVTQQDRGVAIVIEVPSGPGGIANYNHSITVWGIDYDNNLLYVTDSDDGLTAMRTYSISQPGGAGTYWFIDNYSNLYTSPTSARILEVHRLLRNDPPQEPNRPNGGIPEPSTLGLFGAAGVVALLRRYRIRH